MAETDKSFWGHLDDLRKVLFKMAGVLAVFMAGFFYFMPWLFDNVIMAPCHGDFALYRLFADITGSIPGLEAFSTSDFNVEIINYNLTAQFFTHINLSLWLAVVFAFPVLLYLLWTFVRPALYEKEVRGARIAFALGTVMFYLGVAVGYFLVFPITMRFLFTYQLSSTIHNQLSLDSYMDNFLMLNLVMGLVFELPLLAAFETGPRDKNILPEIPETCRSRPAGALCGHHPDGRPVHADDSVLASVSAV